MTAAKRHYVKNREKILEKQRVWRASPEGQRKERENHLKKKYGITSEDYERMHENQDGKCAICETTETGDRRAKHFTVDHCHETGKVRGLLCHRCNTALGLFEDKTDRMNNAIQYLRKHDDEQ